MFFCFGMKPLLVLTTTSALPILGLVVLGQQPGIADAARPVHQQQLLASLPTLQTKFWIQASNDTTFQSLAAELDLPVSALAELNEQSPSAALSSGQWIILPTGVQSRLSRSLSLDASSIRRSAPVSAPPAPVDEVKVQQGDSLAAIAKRHGLSLTQLRQLNPGRDLARLVVGAPVRVAEAAPRQLLAIRPSVSGGASWPVLPRLPGDSGDQQSDRQAFIWPAKGVFTSGYGWRWGRMHKGIDIANNVGTPIVAAKDGLVVFSGWSSGYGYLVELAHGDGTATRYAHNSRLVVRKGQMVPQGTTISLMGSTGRSTGPHLHFEIRQPGGAATDPMSFLPSRRA